MKRNDLLLLAPVLGLFACGNGSTTGDPIDPYSAGAGGAMPGAGGVPSGGLPPAAGGAAAAGAMQSTGGSPVPPGQLVCAGKLCAAGGYCAASGACPAGLGDCFSHDAGFDTCAVYCKSKGLECAAHSCGPDGSAFDPPNGVTTVSYPAARKAECGVQPATQYADDECTTPIWLSPTKPLDDVVRCCCR
jgi:hypothetical protein